MSYANSSKIISQVNVQTSMNDERTVYIYALCEPETNEIRYIGQTIDIPSRLSQHKYHKSSDKDAKWLWLYNLRAQNLDVVVKVLAEVKLVDANDAERKAISQAISDGADLLNQVLIGTEQTQFHIIRMSDEHWNKLAEVFRQVIPIEAKPRNVNPKSNWQITTGLKMITEGKIKVCSPEKK